MSEQRSLIFASLQQLQQLNDDPLTFSVTGNSMWPTLRAHDEVIVDKSTSYACGDIILFESSGMLIVHRIIRQLSTGQYVAKGDNRRIIDPPVADEHILGRVIGIQRNNELIRIQSNRQRFCRFPLQYSWLISRFCRLFLK